MKHLVAGTLKLEIHPSRQAAGAAAARAVAEELRRLDQPGKDIGVIFATGASQFETLEAPLDETGVLRVNALLTPDEIAAQVARWMGGSSARD